ncbi:hypothetical protein A9F13_01g08558 [Clavispora lusitaniae]|uniref:Uncharacterized protein n=1 Tax=Clavispora lusitaniae TaxID=36911 RepID=A0AA91Q5Q3_CLALS|nr:hypothetical protein A9F13_01g08558 [Clavispora lusitaniae]
MSQYIGKTISLISNKGLRYVGVLENINAEDATLALSQVRSLGTEGRMAQVGQPQAEVLPGADVYEHVVFRGSDVKDLSVIDVPVDQVGAHPGEASPQERSQSREQEHREPTHGSRAGPTPSAAQAAAQAPSQTSTQAPAQTGAAPASGVSGPRPTPVSGGAARPQPSATAADRASATQTSENAQPGFDTAFDFESANARFEKEHAEHKPVYSKEKGFFDSMSVNEGNGMRWNEERSLNMDTFGQASVRRGRGNFRGRGRGNFRGRGRGRGRGKPEPKPEWA